MSALWKVLLLLALLWLSAAWLRTVPVALQASPIKQARGLGPDESASSLFASHPAPHRSIAGHATGFPRSPVRVGEAGATSDPFHFDRVIISPVSTEWTPEKVVVGDVTGDHRSDVVVTLSSTKSQGWIRVQIHAQSAAGTLSAPVQLDIQNAINWGHGLELADLDGNGVPEIVVADEMGLTVIAWNSGDPIMSFYPGIVRNNYLAAVDADGDGNMDVYAQSWSEGADIYLGDGRGRIRAVNHVASSPIGYNTIETSDFTMDGLKDVVVTNGQGWPLVWVYPFKPGQGLQPAIQIDLRPVQSSPAWGMTVADLDRDGRPDLVTSDENAKGVRIFYRGAGNTFSSNVLLPTPGYYDSPGAVAVADVDGNGYPDVVTMLNSSDQMAYFLQDSSGFAPAVKLSTDDDAWTNSHYNDHSFAIADVNSDRCPDVVLAELSSSLRIFYGRDCQIQPMRTGGPLPRVRR